MQIRKEDGYPLAIAIGTYLSITFILVGEYSYLFVSIPSIIYGYYAGTKYFEKYSEYWEWDEDEFENRIIRAHLVLGGILFLYWFFFNVL